MSITDKIAVRGGADYTFVCSKIPFAITCSTDLPHTEHNLIDLDLINKMKVPLRNVKVKRMVLMGRNVRYVGSVSQTIQCVSRGKVCGTIHLQALVVRDLFNLFNVDSIASSKTYERLTGRKPPKPTRNDAMDEEEDDENTDDTEEDDEIGDDTEDDETGDDTKADDKIGGDKVSKDQEDDTTKEGLNKNQKQNDDHDSGRVGEADIQDIPWNWGVKPVPTVDELYPDEDPADNARWYQELHQPRPRTPPSRTIGKTKIKYKTNVSTEDYDEKMFCKLCFHEGEPLTVVMSHHNLDITCPTMTDTEKETMYGPNWIARMYGYPD